MSAIGLIGILVAMVLFLVMVYKNCVSYWVAILCAIIVALTNELDILSALFTLGGEQSSFLQGMVDLLPTMFKVVFMGAIIGKLYTDSGAVTSIANALIRAFVEKRQGPSKITAAVIVIAVLNCLLTLGGIDGYVLTFTMVPICLAVCQQCNIPRRFIGGFMTLNCAFMVFPGSPQIYNVMGVAGAQAFAGGAGLNPAELGISSTMGMIPGVVASIIIAVLSVITMIIVSKRAVARGETFEAGTVEMPPVREGRTPHVILCILPLIVVFVLYSIVKLDVFWALLAGMILAAILFLPFLPKQDVRGNQITLLGSLRETFNHGANQYPNALMSVITPAGLAAVVTSTATFGAIIGMLSGLPINPIILAVIMTLIIVALTSSPPATLMIVIPAVLGVAMQQFAGDITAFSVPAIARTSIIAASTLETLPFNGLIVLTLGLTHCTHKQSYKYMFLNTVVYTTVGTIVAAVLFILFPGLG